MVSLEDVLKWTMESGGMLIEFGRMMEWWKNIKIYVKVWIKEGRRGTHVEWWVGGWNTYGLMYGNVGKIKLGTHFEVWWSCRGVDFGFIYFDEGVDFGKEGPKIEWKDDGEIRIVDFYK